MEEEIELDSEDVKSLAEYLKDKYPSSMTLLTAHRGQMDGDYIYITVAGPSVNVKSMERHLENHYVGCVTGKDKRKVRIQLAPEK